MEFPHNRHTHHHHHHRGDDDYEEERKREYYPPPGTFHPDQPPPYRPQSEFVPPPSGYYQDENFAPPPPPPPIPTPYVEEVEYGAPPPPRAGVIHVSHEQHETLHSFHPHLPSFGHHQYSSESGTDLSNKPTVRIYSKAEPNFGLTIRDGKVILAPSDPSDDFQKWYKDEKYSTRVKDEEGCPCFSLVNKVTGEAIKHSIGDTHPVQLVRYNPDYLDESVLWTESKDLSDGYRAIRMVNNIHLNVDAFHGDKHSGGVHEGTIIVLWKWNKGDNQRWKIAPN
ncbi:hypothetical protein K2173_017580 [Erythroxylum novogranatense]|uniref:Ricin B-like lectin R40G3 n=1 Tax=Erythroxylum novogranatense TaxID=1862640 RepID=A0AAV8T983_9ROSI|nr:hypothetical protein K2173_017580 [Erythroxylum novogranatense]